MESRHAGTRAANANGQRRSSRAKGSGSATARNAGATDVQRRMDQSNQIRDQQSRGRQKRRRLRAHQLTCQTFAVESMLLCQKNNPCHRSVLRSANSLGCTIYGGMHSAQATAELLSVRQLHLRILEGGHPHKLPRQHQKQHAIQTQTNHANKKPGKRGSMPCGLVTRFGLDGIRKRRGGLECETAVQAERFFQYFLNAI